MLVTLNIENESMKEKFLNSIGTLDYIEIKNVNENLVVENKPQKDKFKEFAGLWDDSVKIKDKAWKR